MIKMKFVVESINPFNSTLKNMVDLDQLLSFEFKSEVFSNNVYNGFSCEFNLNVIDTFVFGTSYYAAIDFIDKLIPKVSESLKLKLTTFKIQLTKLSSEELINKGVDITFDLSHIGLKDKCVNTIETVELIDLFFKGPINFKPSYLVNKKGSTLKIYLTKICGKDELVIEQEGPYKFHLVSLITKLNQTSSQWKYSNPSVIEQIVSTDQLINIIDNL